MLDSSNRFLSSFAGVSTRKLAPHQFVSPLALGSRLDLRVTRRDGFDLAKAYLMV